jgi:hypothetical protein
MNAYTPEKTDFEGIDSALARGGILSVFKGPKNIRIGQILVFSNPQKLNYTSEAMVYGYHMTDLLTCLSDGYKNRRNGFVNITNLDQGQEGVEQVALNFLPVENILDKWVFNHQTYTSFKDRDIYKVQFHKNSVLVSEIAGDSFTDMYNAVVRKEYPSDMYDRLEGFLAQFQKL